MRVGPWLGSQLDRSQSNHIARSAGAIFLTLTIERYYQKFVKIPLTKLLALYSNFVKIIFTLSTTMLLLYTDLIVMLLCCYLAMIEYCLRALALENSILKSHFIIIPYHFTIPPHSKLLLPFFTH